MQFTFNLQLISFCLVCTQVLGQDVRPEFPEDFPTTTIEAGTELPTTTGSSVELTSEPATASTEYLTTTTKVMTTPPETTTEPITTTTTKATTDTTTEAAEEPVPTTTELPEISSTPPVIPSWPPGGPYFYPTYAPATRPPHFTPTYHWLWDLYESEEVARCYLREQTERSRVRWGCGYSRSLPIISCYRCCYYGNSRFAGCTKLHSGVCHAQSSAWQI
ncbi:mucin-2 [Drosophila sulfurigaster albostrigata]|uniref:mucin-2 n=1 Tax=Drosophila sulfurigaster albostrigata TaxID=89887 RepID=UPI002D218AD6|nr:mucin-2 [Drosophila sulfurigaster albostrigata]